MTNEEIIGQLEWVRKRISDITYSPESFEAINSAIEAVKKQDEILENNKNLCKHCEELKGENKMLSDVKENLEKKIEFLMQQIRLWQSWESTEQQGKDCVENMNEQETFIEEEKKWSYEQGYKDGSIEGSAEEYDKGWRQGFLDCLDNKGCWEEIEILPEVYDIKGVKTWASKMMCSKCGFTTIAIEGKFTQYNGCPNCFADMRGDKE